jgi:hypothetical protein
MRGLCNVAGVDWMNMRSVECGGMAWDMRAAKSCRQFRNCIAGRVEVPCCEVVES